jgi:hypothetical protein
MSTGFPLISVSSGLVEAWPDVAGSLSVIETRTNLRRLSPGCSVPHRSQV